MIANLNIRSKIGLLSALLMLFIIVMAFMGITNLTKSNHDMSSMYKDRLLAIQQLNEDRAYARNIEADIYNLILNVSNSEEQNVLVKDIEDKTALLEKNLKDYKNTKLEKFEINNLKLLQQNYDDYISRREVVISLATEGEAEAAKTEFQYVKQLSENYQKNLSDLANFNSQLAKRIQQQNDSEYSLTFKVFIGLFVSALILSIGITWFISRQITVPITRAIRFIEEVAEYNISNDISKDLINRKDEIGNLTRAIQKIKVNLSSLIREIDKSSEHVSDSSKELSVISHQSARTSEELAKTIEEISQGVAEQADLTSKGVSKLSELGELIEQDKIHIELLTETTTIVEELVGEGLDIIKNLSNKTKDTLQATENVFESIKKTNESSERISEASKLISSIASQTNLLALNAAIEAARAGENGKGFAVVAEEIRKLAEQSTLSTKTIDAMVKSLQIDSCEAVNTMVFVDSVMRDQVNNVSESECKYLDISNAMKKAGDAVDVINESGRKMEDKKNEVLETIHSLTAVAESNASGSEEASASIEEQSSSMMEIADASESLLDLSKKLRTMFSKFKL